MEGPVSILLLVIGIRKKRKIDDLAVSNNQDRDKIFATVAETVLEFTENFPDLLIYAEGSTASRTRLYQISISNNLNKINDLLNVYGFTEESVIVPFRKNINYKSFAVSRNKILNL